MWICHLNISAPGSVFKFHKKSEFTSLDLSLCSTVLTCLIYSQTGSRFPFHHTNTDACTREHTEHLHTNSTVEASKQGHGAEADHTAAAAAALSLVSLHNTDYNPEI